MRFIQAALSTAVVALLSVAVAMPANAAPPVAEPISASVVEDPNREAREFLTAYGVDKKTQRALFEKLEAGLPWDSFTSNSVPVSTADYVEDGFQVTESRYADGSVSVSRMQIPVKAAATGDFSVMSSPNSCTIGSNGARTNCIVDMWVGAVSMSFRANYNVVTSVVSSVWGASYSIGAACSASVSYLGRPTSNIGLLTVTAQMCVIGYASAFNLQVTLSKGIATESWW